MTMQPLLWRVMEHAGASKDVLRKILEEMTQEQLILLARRFQIAAAELRSTPGFRAESGQEQRLAEWVVSQGQRAWLDAKAHPEKLPPAPPPSVAGFGPLFEEVYRQRFGSEMPENEPEPSNWRELRPDPSWEERLWELIDIVNLGVPLVEAVSSYTRSELILLEQARRDIVDCLEDQLYALAKDSSEDRDWVEVAEWIIGRGKAAADRLLAHPSEAPSAVPEDEEWFGDLLEDVYRQRYGARWPMIVHSKPA